MTRVPLAIIVAAALIAVAFGLTHRYSVVASNGTGPAQAVWVVDQITGAVLLCAVGTGKFACIRPSRDVVQIP